MLYLLTFEYQFSVNGFNKTKYPTLSMCLKIKNFWCDHFIDKSKSHNLSYHQPPAITHPLLFSEFDPDFIIQ